MRLIDADAFLKRNEVYADCEFLHPMYQNTLREIVDDEPTIDAVPVVHGKWIHLYKNNYRCSVCGAWFIFEDENNPYEEGRFCPYCGARMAGERRANDEAD